MAGRIDSDLNLEIACDSTSAGPDCEVATLMKFDDFSGCAIPPTKFLQRQHRSIAAGPGAVPIANR